MYIIHALNIIQNPFKKQIKNQTFSTYYIMFQGKVITNSNNNFYMLKITYHQQQQKSVPKIAKMYHITFLLSLYKTDEGNIPNIAVLMSENIKLTFCNNI